VQFSTKLIHHPYALDPSTGGSSPSVQRSSTFLQRYGEDREFTYSRGKNPTRQILEDTICTLENGHAGFAFSSGMAAIAAVLGIFSSGDHLVVAENLYGGTEELLADMADRFGLEITYINAQDLSRLDSVIGPRTRGLYVETPANPTMNITDLRAVAEIGHRHKLIVMADNTFMSPYLQRPLGLGLDLVVHSATKFLGGHSDLLAGLVVAKTPDLAQRIHAQQRIYGGILSPDDSWLLLRGMKTLAVRLDRAQSNAMTLSHRLVTHPHVSAVYYPGLDSHPGASIHRSQSDGPGAVMSFTLGPEVSVETFLSRLQNIFYGPSLGGVETIISHPSTMSHAFLIPEAQQKFGITPQLLRVSVGIEDVRDITDEFDRALL